VVQVAQGNVHEKLTCRLTAKESRAKPSAVVVEILKDFVIIFYEGFMIGPKLSYMSFGM
jgi:hypothetical protein